MSGSTNPAHQVTYRRVAAIALPVVISNATVPLQGAIDTAIIGNLGAAVYLAAVTLGASAIALLLSVFNFLQFGAGALGAQALGAGDKRRVINVLARALIIALGLALLLIVLQVPLRAATMWLFEGSARAEALASTYFHIRIWAAPAELANFAIIGWFSGQELTRRLVEIQIVTSVSNILLNLFFVLGLGMDVDGVALGTVIAAYLGIGFGLCRARARVRVLMPDWRPERTRLLNPAELGKLMRLNRDIFLRTVMLITAFTMMTRLGSLQGDVILAANGILYQIFHITSYGLDGFAIAAESLVGQAAGARDRRFLRRAVVVSSVAATMLAMAMCLAIFAAKGPVITVFTNVEAVRAAASEHYFWAALMPIFGIAAYQLDGIFVGATEGPAMRNAMIVSTAIYLPLSLWLFDNHGNHGVWAAIAVFMGLRAITLGLQYPRLERRIEAA